MFSNLKQKFLLSLFIRIGGKLFTNISIYTPPETSEEDNVNVVHFYTNERDFVKSCKDIIENSINYNN